MEGWLEVLYSWVCRCSGRIAPSLLKGKSDGLELLCGQGIWVYQSFVGRVAGCLLDYHGCGLVVFVYEGEIPLDSDSGDFGLFGRSWITRCLRRNYVSPSPKVFSELLAERIMALRMQ